MQEVGGSGERRIGLAARRHELETVDAQAAPVARRAQDGERGHHHHQAVEREMAERCGLGQKRRPFVARTALHLRQAPEPTQEHEQPEREADRIVGAPEEALDGGVLGHRREEHRQELPDEEERHAPVEEARDEAVAGAGIGQGRSGHRSSPCCDAAGLERFHMDCQLRIRHVARPIRAPQRSPAMRASCAMSRQASSRAASASSASSTSWRWERPAGGTPRAAR